MDPNNQNNDPNDFLYRQIRELQKEMLKNNIHGFPEDPKPPHIVVGIIITACMASLFWVFYQFRYYILFSIGGVFSFLIAFDILRILYNNTYAVFRFFNGTD